MKFLLATGLAFGLAASAAHAQQPITPGPEMQGQGSVQGSGAGSTGGLIQGQGATQGTVGASGSAPGRVGADVDTRTGVKAGGVKANSGAKARTGADIR